MTLIVWTFQHLLLDLNRTIRYIAMLMIVYSPFYCRYSRKWTNEIADINDFLEEFSNKFTDIDLNNQYMEYARDTI